MSLEAMLAPQVGDKHMRHLNAFMINVLRSGDSSSGEAPHPHGPPRHLVRA